MRRRRLLVVALAGVLAACSSSAAERAPTATGRSGDACLTEPVGPLEYTYRVVEGIEPGLTSLDVYVPASCEPVPALIWLHGGAWVSGDKRDPGVAEKVALAHSLDMALVSVNYRLASEGGQFRWPTQVGDAVAAIVWLRENGSRLRLDMARLIVGGFAAGGHIATMVAADPAQLAFAGVGRDAVDCVVALDTSAFDLRDPAPELESVLVQVFGTVRADREQASPIVQVERFGRPGGAVLVVASKPSARVARQLAFVDMVVARGGWARLFDGGDYDHEEMNLMLGAPGETRISEPVRQFLQSCKAGEPGLLEDDVVIDLNPVGV
jgi:acetyl esterase/lipase